MKQWKRVSGVVLSGILALSMTLGGMTAPDAGAKAKKAKLKTKKISVTVGKKKTIKIVKKKKSVQTNAKPAKKQLSFNQEEGLSWPIKGDVLMEYSADKVVYFKTLAQYRTNPALLLEAKEGMDVKASADGIVESVETSEETGRTVSISIGDGFTVVYGQLKDISVSKGDMVSEGQVLGKIAEPTKYYKEEGTNLYFQVKENKTTVNPMLLLQ